MAGQVPSKQLSFGPSGDSVTSILISTPTIAAINTEQSHVLQSDLKQLRIRARSRAEIKWTLVSGESGTKFTTISPGCVDNLNGLLLTGKTLYFQVTAPTVIEIVEFF